MHSEHTQTVFLQSWGLCGDLFRIRGFFPVTGLISFFSRSRCRSPPCFTPVSLLTSWNFFPSYFFICVNPPPPSTQCLPRQFYSFRAPVCLFQIQALALHPLTSLALQKIQCETRENLFECWNIINKSLGVPNCCLSWLQSVIVSHRVRRIFNTSASVSASFWPAVLRDIVMLHSRGGM